LTEKANIFHSNLKNKVYSVSQLENYAQCPFQYFVKNILKIDEKKYADDALTALDFGNYIHLILEKFYKKNLEKSENFINNFPTFDVKIDALATKQKYLAELREIANDLINEMDFPMFFYEKERIIGKNGILEIWLNNEIEKNKNWSFSSILFEYKFGAEKPVELKEVTTNDFIKLKGKIDRIEIFQDKNFDENFDEKIYFLISDYKTSSASAKTLQDTKAGKSLQIPLYLLAIQQLFSENQFVPFGGGYYILYDRKKKSSEKFANIPLSSTNFDAKNQKFESENSQKNVEKFNEILEKSLNFAIKYKNQINELDFEISKEILAENKANCRFCDYQKVCRKEEIFS
jgi:ATP-dependent helicase/nuclease subunit B